MKIFTLQCIAAKKDSPGITTYFKRWLPVVFMVLLVLSSVASMAQCAVTGSGTTTATCVGSSSGTATITLSGTGSGAPGTYTVDGGSPQAFSSNPFTITGLAAGNHTIVATITAGPCVSSDISITVATSALALPTIIPVATASSICIGASSNLTATGASNYTWSPGALSGSSVSVSPTTTTTYTVTGANADGCTRSTTWAKVAAGGYHNLAIKTDGTLWAWGQNTNGQIGDGTNTDKNSPVQIGTANNWAFVSAGDFHSLAIKTDGTLWAWGFNSSGQLGDGTTVDKNVPVQIGVATNWVSISGGGSHSLAIRTGGTLWAWGSNVYGQIGDATNTQRNSPVQAGVATNWASISAGSSHSLGIKSDGTLWAWGRNSFGGLGDGTTVAKNSPVQIGVGTNWSKISACFYHSLAVKTDGTLWSWGYNSNGQLGDNTVVNKSSPLQVGVATDWANVEGGLYHSLAIKTNGTLWACGINNYGQLGDGTFVQKTTLVQSGTATNWSTVQGGLYHTMGIRSDASLWGWGYNMLYGQLGDGTLINRPSAVQINSVPFSVTVTVNQLPVVSFSGLGSSYCLSAPTVTLTGSPAGGTFSGPGITGNTFNPAAAGVGTHNITYSYTNGFGCSNTASQSVQVTFTNILDYVNLQFPGTASVCQGTAQTVYGQLYEPGLTEAAGAGAGVTVELGYSNTNTNPATWINWQPASFNVQVGNNDEYSSSLNLPAGTYYYAFRYTYTANVCGYQYGGYSAGGGGFWDGSTYVSGVLTVNALPTLTVNGITGGPVFVYLCPGTSANLTASGASTYLWMPGSLTGATIPVSTTSFTQYTVAGTTAAGCTGNTSWASASAGANYNLVIRSDGTLWGSGYNVNGQLGDGTTTSRTSLTKIGTATNWVTVSAGSAHSLAIKSDGTLWAWGLNGNGQLGDGTVVDKTSPIQIGSATNWVAISGGGNHSMGIKSDGTLWAWGLNTYGQLGDGSFTQRTSPVQVGTATNWAAVAAGGSHTIALKNDGTLWVFGRNGNGQLGDGTLGTRNVPFQIGTEKNWKKIGVGFFHSLAIKTDGTLWAWGKNNSGQIGDNTTVDKLTPTKIGVATTWASIDGGVEHTIATKTNGTLWGWGLNNQGAVGDGTITQRLAPVQDGVVTNWMLIDAGSYHNIANRSDGTLWAWGRGAEGQNGSGFGQENAPRANGQEVSGWVYAYEVPNIGVTASPTTVCAGQSSTLTASHSGVSYIWTPGNMTGRIVTVNPTTTTIYTVIGTDDITGCKDTATVTVTVKPLPVVSFTGLASSYCLSDAPTLLTGTPAGGTFPGLSGNTFDPAALGVGPYTITYVYTDPVTGCQNMSQQLTSVSANSPVSVSISANPGNTTCTGTSVTFTATPINGGVTPAYQWYKGVNPISGATANTYTSSALITGDVIKVVLTSSSSSVCANGNVATSNSITMTVSAPTPVSFSGLDAVYCVTGEPATLTGSPSGGTFSGTGISGNSFNPATAGVGGPYTITYTYTNGSCTNSSSQTVSVGSMSAVSFSGLAATYCSTDGEVSLTGSPEGGIFDGPGMTGNIFEPAVVGAGGPYTITYTYTNEFGCSNSVSHTVTVTTCATGVTVNMKLFLQGYYLGGSTMQPVMLNQGILTAQPTETDYVTIKMHDPNDYSLLDAKVSTLNTDGTVSETFSLPPGEYYIEISHRNSVQTWTANPVTCSASTPLYDFTTAANKAYGDNQAQVETGVWAFYSGDINQDEYIDGNDFPVYDLESGSGGLYDGTYTATDMNGDGFVDGNDFPTFDVNSFNFVGSIHP